MTTFTVYGPPATKGSTVSFADKRGQIITKTDSVDLPAWTYAVGWAARAAKLPLVTKGGAVLVCVRFEFVVPPASTRIHPTVKPDLDKLLRATLDALTGIAYDDDSQVIEVRALKVYGPRALTVISVAPAVLI